MAYAVIISRGIKSLPMLKCSSDRCVCAPHSLSAGTSTTPRLSVSFRMLLIAIAPSIVLVTTRFERRTCSPLLGEIEAQRGVHHEIAPCGRSSYSAPKVAMNVCNLIALFDPAGVTSIEAIPVADRRFINIANRPTALIERDLVGAPGVTHERRTVACGSSIR